jgi:MerC mercury resistance protein
MNEKSSPLAAPLWLDSFGTTVSVACAIQCTLFPLMIGIFPLLGLGFLVGDEVEKVFLGSSIVLAVSSFSWGFRHHRRFYIFVFLISGLGLIFFGRFGLKENFELPFVLSGALLIARGHLINRRLCRLCDNCKLAYEKPAA